MSDIVEEPSELVGYNAGKLAQAVEMLKRALELVRASDAEITRLRADLAAARLERDGWAALYEQRNVQRLGLLNGNATQKQLIAKLEADLAAAQEREQRMREALEAARGFYQVTHIHAAIDAALGEPQ